MAGFGTVVDTPRLQLALQRDDLAAVESLLGEPAVRRSNWFYLSSMAAHLDGLAALGDRARVEDEARRLVLPGAHTSSRSCSAPSASCGRTDLVERAADEFDAVGLAWHAAQTRARSS